MYFKSPIRGNKGRLIEHINAIIEPPPAVSIPESNMQSFNLDTSIDAYNDTSKLEISIGSIPDHDSSNPTASIHLTILYYLYYIRKYNLYVDGDIIVYIGPPLNKQWPHIFENYRWSTDEDDLIAENIHYINIRDVTIKDHEEFLTMNSIRIKSYLLAYNNTSTDQIHFYPTLWIKLPFVGKSTRLIYGVGVYKRGKVKKIIYEGSILIRNATLHCRAGVAYISYINPPYMSPHPVYDVFKTDYSTMMMYYLFKALEVEDSLVHMLLLHPAGP